MQWSFSNKASALPRLLSFKATQDDDGPRSTGFDSLTSAGFMTISGVESFDSNHKPYLSVIQGDEFIPICQKAISRNQSFAGPIARALLHRDPIAGALLHRTRWPELLYEHISLNLLPSLSSHQW